MLYNSYRVMEKLPHLWSQCFHSYCVMEENSILGCNSGHYSVVASLQKLITLRLTLKPLLLLQLSTVLCCSVIPKCRQQKRNKWNVMLLTGASSPLYIYHLFLVFGNQSNIPRLNLSLKGFFRSGVRSIMFTSQFFSQRSQDFPVART